MSGADTKYRTGWPDKRGMFRCKVGDTEQILVHHYCGDTKRHWWSDTAGYDVIGEVRFDPVPFAARK